jgi:protein phosphatase
MEKTGRIGGIGMSRGRINEEYLRFSAAAVKGMGDRPYQEDTCALVERAEGALLAMVADGMGGMQDGRRASRAAVSTVKNAYLRFDLRANIPTQLREAMVRANNLIYEQLLAEGGSTGIACVFYDGRMSYASVGDSFLFLLRDGVLYQLNRRQNVYYTLLGRLADSGVTDRSPAEHHPERDALTGYLGMKSLTDVDLFLRPLPLCASDTILICSDGVGDVLDGALLTRCLSAADPQEACRRLDESVMAAEKSHQDNYTAIVVKVTGDAS